MVRGIRFTNEMTGIRSVSTTAEHHGIVVVKAHTKELGVDSPTALAIAAAADPVGSAPA